MGAVSSVVRVGGDRFRASVSLYNIGGGPAIRISVALAHADPNATPPIADPTFAAWLAGGASTDLEFNFEHADLTSPNASPSDYVVRGSYLDRFDRTAYFIIDWRYDELDAIVGVPTPVAANS